MDILDKDYTNEEHVLVFDNTTTHLKCEEDALSATKMPKFTPAIGKNWGVEVDEVDEDCNVVHGTNSKVLKMHVNMVNAKFADGCPQSLYWPEDHACVGVFKGMAVILQECGFVNILTPWAQCKDFKCTDNTGNCCCQQILYNQPDFVNVPLKLERMCKPQGYQVMFLLKFHCELNFIEQCWGYSKWFYHQYPASLKEANLEHNVLMALNSVPLVVMQQSILPLLCQCSLHNSFKLLHSFATHAHRFIDAYAKGLQGEGAAWAAKKYRGHWVLLESILAMFDKVEKAGKP